MSILKSRANRDKWLSIEDEMFFDVDTQRLVYFRTSTHQEQRGLPLLIVDFLQEGRAQNVRDGFGKNVPEQDAKALIAHYPERIEDDCFYNLLMQVIDYTE